MDAPQIILSSLLALEFCTAWSRHGEARAALDYSDLVGVVVAAGLLTWGGFFARIGYPQIFILSSLASDIFTIVKYEGQERRWTLRSILATVLVAAVLWAGGFWEITPS